MPDRPEPQFGERIRQALGQFPAAVWLDDTPIPAPLPLTAADEALDGKNATVWEPTAERPAEYPPHLPFLPHARAIVMNWSAHPDVATVIWDDPPQAEAAVQELVRMSRLEGWEESEPRAVPGSQPFLERSLTKDNVTRLFLAVTRSPYCAVSLIQITEPQEAA
jgi:hypothetical protein